MLRSFALLVLAAQTAAAEPQLHIQSLGRGAYVLRGEPEAAAPANPGLGSNIGVIATGGGVIVIGTGPSTAFGERLRRRVERRFGQRVVLAINTQATPDHVLGNPAFIRRGIPILAHRETDRYMVQNCQACIQRFRFETAAASHGFARPTQLVRRSQRMRRAGRELEVLYFGPTFQPGSIALFDRGSGVLFAGEMVSIGRVPEVHDSNIENWRRALRRMQRLRVRRVVPAHGPPVSARRMAETSAYLGALWTAVERAYRQGVTLPDAVRTIDLPAYRSWVQYDARFVRNVHFVYLKLEAEELAR